MQRRKVTLGLLVTIYFNFRAIILVERVCAGQVAVEIFFIVTSPQHVFLHGLVHFALSILVEEVVLVRRVIFYRIDWRLFCLSFFFLLLNMPRIEPLHRRISNCTGCLVIRLNQSAIFVFACGVLAGWLHATSQIQISLVFG